ITSQTLVYHTMYECKGTIIGNCVHNQTQYRLCKERENRTVCFDPKELPYLYWVELKTGGAAVKWYPKLTKSLGTSNRVSNLNSSVSVIFDVCKAIDAPAWTSDMGPGYVGCGDIGWKKYYGKLEKYICMTNGNGNPDCSPYCGYGWDCVCWSTANWGYESHCPELEASIQNVPTKPECGPHECTLLNLTLNIGKWKNQKIKQFGIKIWASGTDPGAIVQIEIKESIRESIQHHLLFNSFYHEMETGVQYEIPTVAKNLFVNLAENIAKALNVTNCYASGGTNQGERWPWEAMESNISDSTIWKNREGNNRQQQWILQTSIVGRSCWQNLEDGGRPVGNLLCEGGYTWNKTKKDWKKWGNPIEMNQQLSNWTNGTKIPNGWPTPDGHYWICGKIAFAFLPQNLTGSYMLGTIRPSFFLLPISRGERLGVQLYTETDELRRKRYKRELKIGNWKDDEWPPERIISYYDPATCAEDGSWGYRTPIYMLNRIIRLQAVVEIVVNKTGDALGLVAKQNTKMRTAIYQNRLGLDYLLAQEGGVCGKFNLSNCCLEIDDEGKAINELIREMKKIAHVPTQTWNG
ncbi:ENR1 protein, partial [Eolophus roseicapillus]|nr:ENR1 protein [Eolophus roseicapilla]